MSWKKVKVKPLKIYYKEIETDNGDIAKATISISDLGWHIKTKIDKQSLYLY